MKEKTKGITLVALVVTVIILLILAGVTITYVLGDRGIIKITKDAKRETDEAIGNEQNDIGDLADWLKQEQEEAKNHGNGGGSGNENTGGNGGTTNPPENPDTPDDSDATKGPGGKPLASTVTDTNHETTKVEDKHGNVITVPQGFKVVAGSTGEEITVQNGVVIEDSDGNQFVWIPVGVVTKNDGTKSEEIKLGRYTFDASGNPKTGTTDVYQYAYTDDNPTNYTNNVIIYKHTHGEILELSTARDGKIDTSNRLNDLNATAKDLAGFVNSVKTNGGYYLARYEASYGSGYNSSGSTDSEKYGNAKPLSKPSTATKFDASTVGSLWNYISELNASKVARNMYVGNKDIKGNTVGVESDLANSYAWDTAIVYITEMGNKNFANKTCNDVGGSSSPANTGSNEVDKFCNVYDMVANTREWTTEYDNGSYMSYADPCVYRGGVNAVNGTASTTAYRFGINITDDNASTSFRLLLYVK